MIYIVHGNDLAKSRTQINNIYQNSKKAQKLELRGSLIENKILADTLNSIDIFGNTPFVILDISDLKAPTINDFIKTIAKTPQTSMLIVLCNKDLGKKSELVQKAVELKANIILNNKLMKSNVFKFVDYLFLKDRQNSYKELKLLLEEGADPFYIFSMILYGLRNIALIKFAKNPVSNKFTRQAENFTKNDIKKLYKILYEIDQKTKTGKVPLELMLSYAIEKILSL